MEGVYDYNVSKKKKLQNSQTFLLSSFSNQTNIVPRAMQSGDVLSSSFTYLPTYKPRSPQHSPALLSRALDSKPRYCNLSSPDPTRRKQNRTCVYPSAFVFFLALPLPKGHGWGEGVGRELGGGGFYSVVVVRRRVLVFRLLLHFNSSPLLIYFPPSFSTSQALSPPRHAILTQCIEPANPPDPKKKPPYSFMYIHQKSKLPDQKPIYTRTHQRVTDSSLSKSFPPPLPPLFFY